MAADVMRVMADDVWALWPDDFMCPIGEVDEQIRTGRSDDFERVVVTMLTDGAPSRWHRPRPAKGQQ